MNVLNILEKLILMSFKTNLTILGVDCYGLIFQYLGRKQMLLQNLTPFSKVVNGVGTCADGFEIYEIRAPKKNI